jgi:hypothetical protein
MMRMLIVGYCFGIRSERRLCDEVHLNLAYRWFCRLGLDGDVPDHSTFSKNRQLRWLKLAAIPTPAVADEVFQRNSSNPTGMRKWSALSGRRGQIDSKPPFGNWLPIASVRPGRFVLWLTAHEDAPWRKPGSSRHPGRRCRGYGLLAGALLDRLTHHVNILEMNGDSYRLNQSKRRSRRNNADKPKDDPDQT